jgi:endonuclease/exonuclease/phosphatase family metal-dependent hydrolase
MQIIISLLLLISSFNCFAKELKNKYEKSQKADNELTIAAYNIRHGRGSDRKLNLKRTAEVLRSLNADLIALQEVDKVCNRSKKIDQAKFLGKQLNMYSHFEKFMDFQGGEYGMAVLSRFPIQKIIRHDLPRGSEPRCALEIQVIHPKLEQKISFIGIHNEWNKRPIRTKQIETLVNEIKNYEHSVILAGDFNAELDDVSMETFKDNTWTITDVNGKKTWPSHKANIQIDFFIMKNIETQEIIHHTIDEKIASDHLPIMAKLKLK